MQPSPTPDSRGNSAEVPDAETAQEHGLQEAVRILGEIHEVQKIIRSRKADVSSEPLADMPLREEMEQMEQRLAALAESFCAQVHRSLDRIAPYGPLSIAIVETLRDIQDSMENNEIRKAVATLISNQQKGNTRRAA